MRSMTTIWLLAISAGLLGGQPAFAARAIHRNTRDIYREQNIGYCHRYRFTVQSPSAISDQQAKANAASKVWPGDMVLD
ncbi:hypothetical protein ACVILL_007690 [Bradyrhizobium sp. USDA 3364]